MSHYTTEVRYIVEQTTGITNDINGAITAAVPKIFDFQFPLFDPAYRPVLCHKILLNFYTREIGDETVGLWKLRLNQTLNRIMPYYNQLYETLQFEFNPLLDVDLTTTHHGDTGSSQTGSTSETGTSSESGTTSSMELQKSSQERSTTEKDVSSKESSGTSKGSSTDTENTDRTEDRILSNTETGSETGESRDVHDGDTTTNITSSEEGSTSGTAKSVNSGSRITSNQGNDTLRESETPQGPLVNWQADNYMSFGKITNSTSGGTEETSGTKDDTTSGTSAGSSESETKSTAHDVNTRNASSENNVRSNGTDDLTVKGLVTKNGSTEGSQSASETGETTRTGSGSETGQRGTEGSTRAEKSGKVDKDVRTQGAAATTEDYITRVTGKNGGKSYAALIMEYRDSLINVDAMILDELECCFMQIW